MLKKINSEWYKINEFLIEEYIDWKAYSIDYFVDKDWIPYILSPVYLEFWYD